MAAAQGQLLIIGFKLMRLMFRIRERLQPRLEVLQEAGIKS